MELDIRLIAFDLDDTALDTEKQLRPEVAEALAEAARQGCEILPATGRMLNGIPEAVLAIPGIHYAITSNGAKIYTLPQQRTIYSDCFEKAQALQLLQSALQCGGFVSVFMGGVSYTPCPNTDMLQDIVSPAVLHYLKSSRIYTPNLTALIESSEEPVEKLTLNFSSEAERKRARQLFTDRGGLSISSSMGLNIELNAPGVDKGRALLWLMQRLGIPKAQVMAVGDSDNDVAMLQAAGHGVAMGSASKAIRSLANAVAPSAEEAGLAHAVRQVLQPRPLP